MKRESMIIYRSFFEAIKDLPKENQAEVWNSIFEYGLDFKEPKLKGISNTIFTLIKPQLDANINRYNNGSKPKQKISKTEAKNKQKISKQETNVNDNVNDNQNNNVNIEERKLSFGESLQPYVEKFGREFIKDFYYYWTEETLDKKKLKFETHKTFSIEHRLRTWNKNSTKFGNDYAIDNKPKFSPYG